MLSAIRSVNAPKTALGNYRILSARCGLRVSPLCFGAMGIGEAFSEYLGNITKAEALKLLDTYYDAGGNFIDTANYYQDEQSEEWLGEWMEGRGIRDQIVLATKYTISHKQHEIARTGQGIGSNYGGNHIKSLHIALRDSLRKLKTDYIDILYVHWWDYTTSLEEMMRALDDVARTGKVHYLGICNAPAWIVSKANQYARDHALTPFVIYQGRWNVMIRDMERDIIPMCIDEGMAIAPWGAVGQGRFKSKDEIEGRKRSGEIIRSYYGEGQSALEEKVSAALEKVGKELDASITAVALAYCLQRCPYVFPVVGGRKVAHLLDNIKAVELHLSEEQIKYLESQTAFDPGFPQNVFGTDPRRFGETQCIMQKAYLNLAWVKHTPAVAGTRNV
ncbi:aryl-alcohol dehydrogenase AAD14 [Ramaria rubella]|nr:aryl-alcohol dehydrogenase AAD14 [Ramaria rubella]